MMRLVIHFGFPKTGSSLLQREFFRYDERFNIINIKWSKKNVVDDFLAGNKNHYAIKDYVEGEIKASTINILSCEDFSGEFFTNYNNIRLARDLHKLFPFAEPLIVLREHREYLESTYKHCVRRGFCGSRKSFYQIYTHDKEQDFGFLPSATLQGKLIYSDYVNALDHIFGRVHIASFRRLVDHTECKQEVLKLFGIPDIQMGDDNPVINKGHSDISVILQRNLNLFARSYFNSGGWLPPHTIRYFFHGSRLISPKLKIFDKRTWDSILGDRIHDLESDVEKLNRKFGFEF